MSENHGDETQAGPEAESQRADVWCEHPSNIPNKLAPIWDYDPDHFHLAFDWVSADPDNRHYAVIKAKVSDVHPKLADSALRDECPWHEEYKEGSCGIAYRWAHGLPVTPPAIAEHQRKILIIGGMHRYHLAHFYQAIEMPFLVRKEELPKVLALLPSAKVQDLVPNDAP